VKEAEHIYHFPPKIIKNEIHSAYFLLIFWLSLGAYGNYIFGTWRHVI